MKLVLKIKILPSDEQRLLLLQTIEEANKACAYISDVAWENKTFGQYKIHHLCYDDVRQKFNLSAQMVVRCISKVADAYKLDKKKKREFRTYGSISYDARILSYKGEEASVWTVSGRQKIPFVCHNKAYIPYFKGEADLVFKKGKFFLYQTIDIPEAEINVPNDIVGLDFGLADIVCTSEGKTYSSDTLNKYREKRLRIRGSIQSKGTRGCKRLLKRLSGREKTTATIINHTISKQIVSEAKDRGVGLAIEDLSHIRKTAKRRDKTFRSKLNRWNFGQLRAFLTYKCALSGVQLVVVEPSYTSQTCSHCHHIGIRNNKSFKCTNCGNDMDADINAARNIALLGVVVNQPEKSDMYSCSLHRTIQI